MGVGIMSNGLLCSIRVDRELTKEQAQDVAIIRLENYIKETIKKFTNEEDIIYELYNKLLDEVATKSTKLVKVNTIGVSYFFKAFDIAEMIQNGKVVNL